jgi:hypothetical protein
MSPQQAPSWKHEAKPEPKPEGEAPVSGTPESNKE